MSFYLGMCDNCQVKRLRSGQVDRSLAAAEAPAATRQNSGKVPI